MISKNLKYQNMPKSMFCWQEWKFTNLLKILESSLLLIQTLSDAIRSALILYKTVPCLTWIFVFSSFKYLYYTKRKDIHVLPYILAQFFLHSFKFVSQVILRSKSSLKIVIKSFLILSAWGCYSLCYLTT